MSVSVLVTSVRGIELHGLSHVRHTARAMLEMEVTTLYLKEGSQCDCREIGRYDGSNNESSKELDVRHFGG